MIAYFSGTGNSRYVADYLASKINDSVFDICFLLKNAETFRNHHHIGVVFPVYSWGVPPIVRKFIKQVGDYFGNLKEKPIIWSVMTCGDDVGNTHKMLRKDIENSGMTLKGVWSVQMPNIYVLLPGFDVDPKEVRERKLAEIDSSLDMISNKILTQDWETNVVAGSFAGLKTGLVYPLFVKWGISSDKWHINDRCIGCGICAETCPVGNISIKDGHPVWDVNCISCVSCYHDCPQHAIEYGRVTRSKGQYRKNERPIFSRK